MNCVIVPTKGKGGMGKGKGKGKGNIRSNVFQSAGHLAISTVLVCATMIRVEVEGEKGEEGRGEKS